MFYLRFLTLLICSVSALRAWAIVLPEPSLQLDPSRYGDVKSDPEARRKFLKAFAKAYMMAYKREFMEKNKVKEDLFPTEMVDYAMTRLDQLTPAEVLAYPDDGYLLLKKAMDDTVVIAYDHLLAGPKADKLRAEMIGIFKEADAQFRRWQAESEKNVTEGFKVLAEKIEATEQKLNVRIGNLEAGAGITSTDSSKTGISAPLGKTDRIMIFVSLGMALVSLFVTLFKRS